MSVLAAGKTAPPFELKSLDGGKHSLKEGLARGPVLAAFFKEECPTCQYAFPFVQRLYEQFRGKGAQVWGISQSTARDSRSFAKEYGVTFPILIDDYPYETSRQYGLHYVPTLLLITPDGRVEISSEGFCRADFLEIQESLAKHLSATPTPLFLANEKVPEYKPG